LASFDPVQKPPEEVTLREFDGKVMCGKWFFFRIMIL